VLADLTVAIADGGECISDIAVLADRPALFGSVASDSTVWRLLDQIGEPELAAWPPRGRWPGSREAEGTPCGGAPERRTLR